MQGEKISISHLDFEFTGFIFFFSFPKRATSPVCEVVIIYSMAEAAH